jgi:hypothetical protein
MAVWRARETPADGERRLPPLDDLPRLDVLAGDEFGEEAAVELAGACPRGGAEVAVYAFAAIVAGRSAA